MKIFFVIITLISFLQASNVKNLYEINTILLNTTNKIRQNSQYNKKFFLIRYDAKENFSNFFNDLYLLEITEKFILKHYLETTDSKISNQNILNNLKSLQNIVYRGLSGNPRDFRNFDKVIFSFIKMLKIQNDYISVLINSDDTIKHIYLKNYPKSKIKYLQKYSLKEVDFKMYKRVNNKYYNLISSLNEWGGLNFFNHMRLINDRLKHYNKIDVNEAINKVKNGDTLNNNEERVLDPFQ